MGGRAFYRLADRTLNALNDWADEAVSHRLTRRIALFFRMPACNVQRLGFRALALLCGNHAWMKEKMSLSEARCETGAHPVGDGVLRAVLFLTVLTILVLIW